MSLRLLCTQVNTPKRHPLDANLASLANIWLVRCAIRSFSSVRFQSLIQLFFHPCEYSTVRFGFINIQSLALVTLRSNEWMDQYDRIFHIWACGSQVDIDCTKGCPMTK